MNDLLAALKRFEQLLRVRLNAGSFTTEDSIRYCLYLALLEPSKLQPHQLILEYPHPAIPGAKIDTWIEPGPNQQGLAAEFKYDRGGPSERNINKTQRAGKVIHDLYRLSSIDPRMHRIFVYVATRDMHVYFINPSNQLHTYYNANPGVRLFLSRSFVETRPTTFTTFAGSGPDLALRILLTTSLPNAHELRVFELLNDKGDD